MITHFDMKSKPQRNKTKPKDTRRLPQIWATMTETEKESLRFELIGNLRKSSQTIWNWTTGKTRPVSPLERKEVAKIVRKQGYDVSEDTLFS